MKNAGTAMKQIHAGLTIDKVDNVMYVSLSPHIYTSLHTNILTTPTGKISANNTQSAKKSPTQSPRASPRAASTKTNSTRNSQNYNRRNSTRRCSRRATYPSTTPSRRGDYPLHRTRNSHSNNVSRKTTRKRSCASCRLRWPCKLGAMRVKDNLYSKKIGAGVLANLDERHGSLSGLGGIGCAVTSWTVKDAGMCWLGYTLHIFVTYLTFLKLSDLCLGCELNVLLFTLNFACYTTDNLSNPKAR
jgi:hypothetical protein